jgi:hypothetical protein
VARVENVTFRDAELLHCVTLVQMLQRNLNTSLCYELSSVKMNDVDSSETSISIQKLHVEFYVLLTVHLDICV